MTVGLRDRIPAARFSERLDRAVAATETAGLGAMLVGVGSDLRYLTGYEALPLERLTLLVVVPGASPWLLVPRLERDAAEAGVRARIDIRTWEELEDPYVMAVGAIPRSRRVAVSDDMAARHVLPIQRALDSTVACQLASTVMRDLRMIKDAEEIALLRAAAQAADRVVARIARGRLVGRTEAEVAAEVRDRLIAEGHETATFAIVASGPNSASPHHEASDRVIGAGEPIVLDIGGTLGGYGSDITRTLWVTGGNVTMPDARFRELFDVLYDAQAAATDAVASGVPCEDVDAAARRPIEAAGYGQAFFHRTGHGIGLDGHEDPYIVADNTLPLRTGMAFSVEPGIYLRGEYGARIEDIVVCGDDGPMVLNEAPRELHVVAG